MQNCDAGLSDAALWVKSRLSTFYCTKKHKQRKAIIPFDDPS